MDKIKIGDLFYSYIEDYGNTIYECVNVNEKCNCGQNDRCMFQIVCNNNFGFDQTTLQFSEYNQHKGKYVYDCEKQILKNIRSNQMRRFTKSQTQRLKNKLIENEDDSI